MKAMKLLSLCLLSAAAFAAEDRLLLDETVIRGNRELPKVTYVVPWREMLVAEVPDWPVARIVGDEPVAIDRENFRLYVKYYDLLIDKHESGKASAK